MPPNRPIEVVQSKTVVLPLNDVDTDQILPARFLTTTRRTGLGPHAFADWRFDENGEPIPSFPLNQVDLTEHRILIAGRNFGCGSSREHAPWALLDLGFEAVVSTEVADIFRANALKNGLVAIAVDESTHTWLVQHPGATIAIDIRETVVELPNERKIPFRMDPFARTCLLNGVDELGYLLDQQEQIGKFESGYDG